MSLADQLMADLEGSDEEEAEVNEEEEDMDSEDVKPSKLELEQVLGYFLEYQHQQHHYHSRCRRSNPCQILQYCTTQTGCSRL